MPERYADYNKEFPLRPMGRDEDGHKRYGCRKCGKMVPKRCRSFCSEPCRRDVLVRCGTEVRHFVRARDQGWCARCGTHIPTLVFRLQSAQDALKKKERQVDYAEVHGGWLNYHCNTFYLRTHDKRKRELFAKFLRKLGMTINDFANGSLWDAHHKVAVKDGGGKCGLEGLETLCRWCHKRESAGQQKKWAQERKKDDGQMSLIEGTA